MTRYPDYTISDYFCEMSEGQVDVIGDDILIDLPQPYTSEYFRTNGYNRGTLNRFILQNFVDPRPDVNFVDYDNWRFDTGLQQWIYEIDGTVEMVVLDYRYIPNDPDGSIWFWNFVPPQGASGEAGLGSEFGAPLILDGKTIKWWWYVI